MNAYPSFTEPVVVFETPDVCVATDGVDLCVADWMFRNEEKRRKRMAYYQLVFLDQLRDKLRREQFLLDVVLEARRRYPKDH